MGAFKRIFGHGSQVSKYFVSYLAILLIPCLLAAFTYSIFFRDLQSQYDNALISGLTTVMNQVDDSIEKMHHYFFETSNSPLFGEYKAKKTSYNALQLVKLLKVYTDSANYIQKYGFIDGATSHIYTAEGGYGDTVYLRTILDEDSIQEARSDMLSGSLMLKQYKGKAGEEILIYTFPFSVFTIRNANEYGSFFLILDTDSIINQVRPLVHKDCSITFSLLDNDSFGSAYSISDNLYEVFSKENPLAISVTTSSSSMDSRLARNSFLFYAGISATIVVSIILGLFMSQRHTRPIKRMLHNLLPYKRNDIRPIRKNEFEELTDIMDDILDVRYLQNSKINEQQNTIRQNALTLLLLGYSDDTNLKTLSMIGININHASHFAFLLYCQKDDDVAAPNDTALQLLERLVMPAGIELSVAELYHNETIAGIVGYDGEQPNLRERLGKLLQDTALQNHLNWSICVGSCVGSISEVSRSYHEASLLDRSNAKVNIFSSDKSDLLFWNSVSSRPLADLLTVLANDTRADYDDLVVRVLDEIDASTTSSLTRRCAYSGMIEALLAFIKHNKPNIVNFLQMDVSDFLTRDEFKTVITDIIQQYVSFPSPRTIVSSENNISAKIISYVAENSCDANMSIDLIMLQFNISANQVTNIFKTTTGYGFREYVILLRMQKAKELLLSTECSVAEVAKQTGYRSTSYFIKAFKDYYGATPVQYKMNSAHLS